jgi:hypothetical protein
MLVGFTWLDGAAAVCGLVVAGCTGFYLADQFGNSVIKGDRPSPDPPTEAPEAAGLLQESMAPVTDPLWDGWMSLYRWSGRVLPQSRIIRFPAIAVLAAAYFLLTSTLVVLYLPIALLHFVGNPRTDYRLKLIAVFGLVAAGLEAWQWADCIGCRPTHQ